MRLTIRQERFAAEYVVTGCGAEAARRAGYSARTARQMSTENLTKPAIQSEIQARHRVTAAELALSRSDVIAAVLGAIQTAREQCDPATVIRGIMTIAKMMGFDKPEPPVAWQSVPLSPGAERLKAKFAAMSDAELMEIIAARE